MKQAVWKNTVIAESNNTKEVEGNDYFPPSDIKEEYFQSSELHSTCPWKGEASYKSIVVDGEVNKDAAWFYPAPKEAASQIKDHYAFWKGIEIKDA